MILRYSMITISDAVSEQVYKLIYHQEGENHGNYYYYILYFL